MIKSKALTGAHVELEVGLRDVQVWLGNVERLCCEQVVVARPESTGSSSEDQDQANGGSIHVLLHGPCAWHMTPLVRWYCAKGTSHGGHTGIPSCLNGKGP